jgi:hypothetical protein
MKTKSIVKRQNPESKAVKPVKWKPASKFGIVARPKNYRGRWCESTPTNIAKKKAEGWEILDKTKFPELENTEYDTKTTDSNGLTKNILQRNELVFMIMPEEIALDRDEYHIQETDNLTQKALSNEQVKKLISAGDRRNSKNVHSINPLGVSELD